MFFLLDVVWSIQTLTDIDLTLYAYTLDTYRHLYGMRFIFKHYIRWQAYDWAVFVMKWTN